MAGTGEISFQDALTPPVGPPPDADQTPDDTSAAAPPDQPQGTQPGEIPFDQAMLPAGNEDQSSPDQSSAVGAFARGALESALPTAGGAVTGEMGGRAGAELGAQIGGRAGPIGAIAGAAAGGFGGGYLLSKGQDWVLDQLGLREGTGLLSRAQQQADEAQHPYASEAGSLLDTLLGFGVGGAGTPKLARAIGAGIMGTVQAGQDAAQGKFDPTAIALAAAAGAATGQPRAWVSDVADRSAAAVSALKGTGTGVIQSAVATDPGTAGRPDLAGAPVADADKADLQKANDITTTAPGVAADNPAVPEIKGAGNPVGAPMVAREAALPSDPGRDYGKGSSPAGTGVETVPSSPGVSTDPIAADLLSAVAPEPPAPAQTESGLAPAQPEPGQGAPAPVAGTPPQTPLTPAAQDQRNQAIVSALSTPPEGTVPVKLGANTVVSQQEPLHVPPHVAWVLQQPEFQAILNDAGVSRQGHVPYIAGADANSNLTHIDERVPRIAVLPNGRQFNTAQPMILHEQIEKWVMQRLIGGGMDAGSAYKVAHWGFAEPLEDAWYRARGIDPAEAEKWWAQQAPKIQNAPIENVPEGLYQKPYPHDSVANAHEGGIATQHPSQEELTEAHRILNQGTASPAVGEQPTTEPVAPQAPEPAPVALAPEKQAFIDRTLDMLTKHDMPKVRERIMALPPDKQYEAAQQLERLTRAQTGRRPTVNGVQVATRAEAVRRQGVLDRMKAATQQFKPAQPGLVPVSVPDKQATLARLKQMVDAATGGQDPRTLYKPNVKPPEWQLINQAYKLINAKRPSAKMFSEFASAEKLLLEGGEGAARDVQNTARIESDLARGPNLPDASEGAIPEGSAGRVEYPPFDNSNGDESKVFEDQQNAMRQWLNGLSDEDYSLLRDANPELEANVEATQDPAALHAALQNDLTDAQAAQVKAGRRQIITSASDVKPLTQTVSDFLGNESGAGTAPPWLRSFMNPRGIFSPRADDATVSYADSMGARFKQYRNFRQRLDIEARDLATSVSKEFGAAELKKPTFYQPVYRSFEPDGDKVPLTASQQKLRDMLMPMYKKAMDIYQEIRVRRPDMELPAASEGYIRHVQKGIHDWEPGSEDPILGIAKQSLSEQTSAMMDRTFFDLVSPKDNKRYLVSYTDDGGLTRWVNGKATPIKNADLPAAFHPGEVVGINGQHYWIDHATVRDINQHARQVDASGQLQQMAYIENPGYAIVEGYRQVATALERIKMMDHWLGNANLNTAQEARGPNEAQFPPSSEAMAYMARKGSPAALSHPDWKETNLPQFKGWVMAPPLRDVVNGFVKPGLGGEWGDKLERLNARVTKLMFVSPVFHGANVLQAWGMSRGLRWLQPRAYREMMGEDMNRAVKSVSRQDSIQDRILTAGGTLEYPALLNRNALSQIADLFGLDVKQNNSAFNKYVDPVYQASSKAMWWFNDVLLTHLFLEGTERLGLSDGAAVQRAHEIFPSYDVQARVFGSPMFAKMLNDNRIFLFGRYRAGILKSYENIYNGLRSQNPAQMQKAMGYIVGAAFTNMVVFGALDWLAKQATGNSDATVGAHGLMTIPGAIADAYTGKAGDLSYTKALEDIFSLAPFPHAALDMLVNRNYLGKPIVQPQDLAALSPDHRTPGQRLKGLARAGIQAAEHIGSDLIPPLGVAESIGLRHGTNPVAEGVKYLTGVHTPSPGTQRFEKRRQVYDQKAQAERFKHPQGVAEQTFDQVFGR